jgi:hypothetical protein
MNGNIVGEEFEKYVFDQIAQRQKDQYSGYDSLRTPKQLQYLNNKNAWVKLASGVSIIQELDENNKTILYDGIERLRDIVGADLADDFKGIELAKKTVLFNGLSETEPATYKNEKKVEKTAEYNFRSGYNNTQNIWNLSSVYGLGGTDFGQQPMPGIQSVNVKSLNRGSIREANVTLKAYNKFQFAIIELLYLRLGFTMMLEWGNDKFINNEGELKQMGNTIIEDLWFQNNSYTQLQMINAIERYRGEYSGNYDGFFGKVVNFTWTFEADGSYNIDLKLITVGDVVESLQANIPTKSYEVTTLNAELEKNEIYKNIGDSPISNAAKSSKIGKYLFDSIGRENLWNGSNLEYFSLKNYLIDNTRNSVTNFKFDKKINDKYNYFITFGEFLNWFKLNIIPNVKTGIYFDKQLGIETDEFSNIVCYYPNQISLDPRVCIFKYIFGSLGETEVRYSIDGVKTPMYLENLKDYVTPKNDTVLYGRLMNLYLNYDFISKCLNSNTKDGKLSIFKFFQKICDGINSALGGVNNIEPIIKNDKIITFIDQNPIPGYLETLEGIKDTVDLEIYGYNQSSKSSNFVQDISFKTEITPQLASMVSIGTTAGGSSTKNEDGTAFSYWNQGLLDRFQPKIEDPTDKEIIPLTPEEERIEQLIATYAFKSTWYLFASKDNSEEDKFKSFTKLKNIDGDKFENPRRRHSITSDLVKGNYSVKEFINLALEQYAITNSKNALTQDELAQEESSNYAIYLINAFGGSSSAKVRYLGKRDANGNRKVKEKPLASLSFQNSKYTLFDDNFISKGKKTYKVYMNSISSAISKDEENNRTPSSQIGFIPVGFGIKLQGLSGIKIYNKLNIHHSFLPSQYPRALKFLIQKVNHSIQDNNWVTDLDTLSIPKVNQTDKRDLTNFLSAIQQVQTGLLPLENRGPQNQNITEEFKVIGIASSIEGIISQLNENAKPSFKAFFNDLATNYKGYTALINSIGRSIEKSIELKQENPKNADPGRSKHNYYASIDMNIITPQGKTLTKEGMKHEWKNHGLNTLAEKYNLIWGGSFSTYEDCIHFEYTFKIDDAVANATSKYGSVENMKGDNGKYVKLT